MKEDRQLLIILHISPVLLGILPPLIIWLLKKDEVVDMDTHGKEVVNFQLTIMLYSLAVIFLSFLCIGFLLLPFLILYATIPPILNAIKVSNGEPTKYWGAIRFIF